MLSITDKLSIPERELHVSASRSSGPGGQNVNKVNTRVTLSYDIAGSPSLTAAQKRRIGDVLYTRINKEGVLSLSTQRSCSQAVNRADVLEKFCRLLREALTPQKVRKAIRTPRRSIEQRLDQKKQRRQVKQLRIRPTVHDD